MDALPAYSSLRSHWLHYFAFGIVFLLTACGTKPSPECVAFRNLSPNQRKIDSVNFRIEKQIEMYLCVMSQEPPDTELAYQIAERGKEAIPILLNRLESASEGDQQDLLYVFEVMSNNGQLRGRKDVVIRIADVVDHMTLVPIKEDCQKTLKRIQINSGVKPFT